MEEQFVGETNPALSSFFMAIDDYFLHPDKVPYYSVFAASGEEKKAKQFEGWFAGELAYFFSLLQSDGSIVRWENEVARKGIGRVDFVVTIAGFHLPIYLELKALVLGRQGANDYQVDLSQHHNPVRDDIRKLAKCSRALRYCLLFVYPLPTVHAWERFVGHMKLTRLEGQSIPVESYYFDWQKYPSSFGIAKLEVLPPDLSGSSDD